MDVTVRPAAKRNVWDKNAWDLTDLLGRSLGRITEEPGRQFFIDPSERGRQLMARLAPGPHPSLDAALAEIEKRTHGVCHRAKQP